MHYYCTSLWMINALGETSRKVTSHPEDCQPRLSQLPLLLQEDREVVHGGERIWVIRPQLCFAPCEISAVQGLGLASRAGADGLGPAGLDPPASTVGGGKKGEQRPCVWIDEKDAKYSCYHVRCTHIVQRLKTKTQRSTFQHNLGLGHLPSNLPFALVRTKKMKLKRKYPRFRPWL